MASTVLCAAGKMRDRDIAKRRLCLLDLINVDRLKVRRTLVQQLLATCFWRALFEFLRRTDTIHTTPFKTEWDL